MASDNGPAWIPPIYFPISPLMLFPQAFSSFSVYLRQGKDFVLYAGEDEMFTEQHKLTLHESGVRELYVKTEQRGRFEEYVEANLGRILNNDAVPIGERAEIFQTASASLMKDVFDTRLPENVRDTHYERITTLVDRSIMFLCRDDSLAALAPFINHDYKTYTHCMQVFIYTVAILHSFGFEEAELFEAGLGAMLHDVGKTRIPSRILNKPGSLNAQEREVINTHPLQGVAVCNQLPMSQTTINCILFHHEKMDGGGYPAGLAADEIPVHVRAVTIADIYDALTAKRPYAPARTAFEALTLMRHEMRSSIDLDIFRRFVTILSGANIA